MAPRKTKVVKVGNASQSQDANRTSTFSRTTTTTTMSSTVTFAPNERVLCYHGPLIYEAKVLKTEVFNDANFATGRTGQHYFVHYKGWKQTWDEWVPDDRLLKYNEENVQKQKRLTAESKEAQASTAKNAQAARTVSSTSGRLSTIGGRKEGTRGTKRGRDDEDGTRKPDMRIVMPEILKVMLIDDWENVTKNCQLVNLPRTPTVAEILQEFQQWALDLPESSRLPRASALLPTITAGLKLYFDRALGSKLLYRFERPQYHSTRYKHVTGSHVKVGTQKEMSEVYGAEHLLRMLSNLPAMVALTKMDPDSVNILTDYTHWLLKYMERERDRIFMKEYSTAGPGYTNVIQRS